MRIKQESKKKKTGKQQQKSSHDQRKRAEDAEGRGVYKHRIAWQNWG